MGVQGVIAPLSVVPVLLLCPFSFDVDLAGEVGPKLGGPCLCLVFLILLLGFRTPPFESESPPPLLLVLLTPNSFS